mmetsp:Transcript_64243/g.168173  ORF Transcript_64243/g.168173 Transcript_64243/m.168173 type:complete len:216 (-) Transcript_64243:2-649(-)
MCPRSSPCGPCCGFLPPATCRPNPGASPLPACGRARRRSGGSSSGRRRGARPATPSPAPRATAAPHLQTSRSCPWAPTCHRNGPDIRGAWSRRFLWPPGSCPRRLARPRERGSGGSSTPSRRARRHNERLRSPETAGAGSASWGRTLHQCCTGVHVHRDRHRDLGLRLDGQPPVRPGAPRAINAHAALRLDNSSGAAVGGAAGHSLHPRRSVFEP